MTPFSMPLPNVGQIAAAGKPPAPAKPPVTARPASPTKNRPAFETSLDKAMTDKAKISREGIARAKASKVAATGTDGSDTDARETTSKTGEEPVSKEAASTRPEPESENQAQTQAQTEKTTQAPPTKAATEEDASGTEIPHGMDGESAQEMRQRLFDRLLQARQEGPLAFQSEESDAQSLPADAVLMQLAAMIHADKILAEKALAKGGMAQPRTEAGMAPTVAPSVAPTVAPSVAPSVPTLPSTGMAFLMEMLAQTHTAPKAEPTTVQGMLPTADTSETQAMGMRMISTLKGGQPALPQPASLLSAHAPTFSDDLMERVGRMRVFSRGGGTEQMRITLIPEDLGTMDLRLRVDAKNRVHLLITAETDAARELMIRQLPQLREALERQNMGFGEVTVHVDDQRHAGEEMPQWRSGEASDDPEGDGRGQDAGSTLPDTAKGAAISASDGGLSVFA